MLTTSAGLICHGFGERALRAIGLAPRLVQPALRRAHRRTIPASRGARPPTRSKRRVELPQAGERTGRIEVDDRLVRVERQRELEFPGRVGDTLRVRQALAPDTGAPRTHGEMLARAPRNVASAACGCRSSSCARPSLNVLHVRFVSGDLRPSGLPPARRPSPAPGGRSRTRGSGAAQRRLRSPGASGRPELAAADLAHGARHSRRRPLGAKRLVDLGSIRAEIVQLRRGRVDVLPSYRRDRSRSAPSRSAAHRTDSRHTTAALRPIARSCAVGRQSGLRLTPSSAPRVSRCRADRAIVGRMSTCRTCRATRRPVRNCPDPASSTARGASSRTGGCRAATRHARQGLRRDRPSPRRSSRTVGRRAQRPSSVATPKSLAAISPS